MEWEAGSFFDYLLNEIQVVGTPGEGFGACGEGYFRFSTFGSPEDTKEAAGRAGTASSETALISGRHEPACKGARF